MDLNKSSENRHPHGSPGRLPKRLALVGQPNVGKSVLFHALTGTYVTVSNFPGTTVDISHGEGVIEGQRWTVFDTPGVFSLIPRSEDERVARDFLLEGELDAVIQVADAKNLAKSLHLTLELAEFKIPMILALNMSDERRDRGLVIDTKRLSDLLGVPVVDVVATTGEGIPPLRRLVPLARIPTAAPRYDAQVGQSLSKIASTVLPAACSRTALAVALFAKDESAWRHVPAGSPAPSLASLQEEVRQIRNRFVRKPEMLIFEARQHVIQEIIGEVQSRRGAGSSSWLAHLGNLAMRPFPGYLLAGLALFLMYAFVGVFGAKVLVDFFERIVFGQWINPLATAFVQTVLPIPFLQDLLVGPYGTITMALTYAFALILPIVTTFFLFFSFMEDSGYLPRLAVMMDRLFRLIGLNGRAVLPMVLGLGCDTMATVTTRILDTKKEKVIVSLLLTLSVPCSAQLGAILGMAAGLSWKVLAVWMFVLASTMMLVGWVAARVLPGGRSPFLVELPPLRWPQPSNIYKKVKARLKWYTKEVIPLFVYATLVLFFLDRFHLLAMIEKVFSPVVVSFLGLPAKATEAFLIGFFRRDYGAAGFFNMTKQGLLLPRQVVVSMVVITLFMPCVAHLLVTLKERGLKATALISAFVFSFALGVGGAVNWILLHTSFL